MIKFWMKFIGLLTLPLIIVVSAYQFALNAYPGVIKLAHWETASSIIFLLAIIPISVLLKRSSLNGLVKTIFGIFVGLIFFLLAFSMHIHSTCEELAPYIGKSYSNNLYVTSCDF